MKYGIWILCLVIVVGCETRPDAVKTLEKLRTADWDIWREAGYDLALMGDNTVPFLIQTLTNESREARWHACYFLRNSYPDSRALPTLTDSALTHTVSLSTFHWLDQVGRYTIQPSIHSRAAGLRFGFMAWTGILTGPEAHFDIEPPSVDEVNRMLALMETELETEEHRIEAIRTLHQLGELRLTKAIPLLKKLALDPERNPALHEQALNALVKFTAPNLTPFWIQMLDRSHVSQTLAMKALSANGDARALEPLRRITFRENSDTAALALQQLGDDSAVEWLTALAQRKLRHWNAKQRQEGAVTLSRLQPSNTQTQRRNVLTEPWFYANNYVPLLVSDWNAIADKASTRTGLKTLLAHAHPMIQRAAAYELTYLGDASGTHLIAPDLHANDVHTRMEAREALLRANTP